MTLWLFDFLYNLQEPTWTTAVLTYFQIYRNRIEEIGNISQNQLDVTAVTTPNPPSTSQLRCRLLNNIVGSNAFTPNQHSIVSSFLFLTNDRPD